MPIPPPDDIELARRHVAHSERLVAEQRERVEKLAREGFDTRSAERLLETLEQSLQVLRLHLTLEEEMAARPD